eukprot:TRINITY_DN1410_c3_g1_i1.p1 TRINITY_DN1410_c3_g1~~TRINITY_DN1410_c3_g1_i1.p1  ORF type:complete len:478 (-),score=66.79 TRINITY_DN1410_c3_g1_i1:2029-3462(-)
MALLVGQGITSDRMSPLVRIWTSYATDRSAAFSCSGIDDSSLSIREFRANGSAQFGTTCLCFSDSRQVFSSRPFPQSLGGYMHTALSACDAFFPAPTSSSSIPTLMFEDRDRTGRSSPVSRGRPFVREFLTGGRAESYFGEHSRPGTSLSGSVRKGRPAIVRSSAATDTSATRSAVLDAPQEKAGDSEERATMSSHAKPSALFPATLVLMRHGESMWNSMKLFTGDVDIPLTEKGVMEALAGGRAVAHIDFDMIFTSRLVRSKQTALMAMTQSHRSVVPVIVRGGYHGNGKAGDENRLRLRDAAAHALKHAACQMIPVYADKDLNERCYGDLQGLSKVAAVEEFGEEKVGLWRRSHDTRPPNGESLMDTMERSVRFFKSTIFPRLQEGHSVLVVSHGNVLRCIIAHLCDLSVEEMLRLQVVTALPYAYAYNSNEFAQCCVLPPLDAVTHEPLEDAHLGLSSAVKKKGKGGGMADSLI